ncbi:MAG: tRNA (N(6)-L-threonylcarbamoyladenosine(37)-C(2))-methylthiotransferase MtaB [Lachnospiraceae bacterium]|nr:tRNA (N(6)-L-threonylcarbamoyladenosine(37)-C(2))-methylthiotransferase MtaB [Lachnospiraceae bacterium]
MELMQQNFIEKGYQIVPFDKKADVYVVNTCTVTNIADRKSRQMLHRARKLNPDALVVAAGCYVQTDSAGATADEAIDIAVGNNHKTEMVEIVEKYLSERSGGDKLHGSECIISDLAVPVPYERGNLKTSNERIRVDVKIQDGCNQFCTYCAIPLARGRVRSRSLEDILEEVENLNKAGFKEIVLTGIHLSSYGLDLDENSSSYNNAACEEEFTNERLLKVIEEVARMEDVRRIRLGSLEPRVITEGFLRRISAVDKVCPHFHLSLQSGCDETLKRMNRRYTTEEFRDKVRLIREYYEHPAITTDVITGFPGEDDEEFERSYEFIKSIDFYETHVFKYSKRKNTAAAVMPGQNTEAVKAARSERLIALSEENRKRFARDLIGRKVSILIEENLEIGGRLRSVGYTGDYVRIAADKGEINSIVEVEVNEDDLVDL